MLTPDVIEATPTGVPLDFWDAFVEEADRMRNQGRSHYGARTIAEYIRHHRNLNLKEGERPFIVNNNWIPDCARTYMRLRTCPDFFETRDRIAA